MYNITFSDESVFLGGSPDNSLWQLLPEKPIKSIVYTELGASFELTNFEEYNHCVERIQGVNNGLHLVSKAIIMGRVDKRVYQVIFDLQRGIVHQLVASYGEEYSNQERFDDLGNFKGWINGNPLTGWVRGILNKEETPKVRRITIPT